MVTVELIKEILDYNLKKKEEARAVKKKEAPDQKSILVFDDNGVGHFERH